MDFKRITVVVTPAPNQDLISLKDARDELRAQRADDARLRRYIEESSAAIATYTRRVWRQETVTETFYFGGSAVYGYTGWDWGHRPNNYGGPMALVLSRFPVASIGSVSIPDSTMLDPSGYVLDAAKGLLYRRDCDYTYDAWGGNVSVTYTGGYKEVDDVPGSARSARMARCRRRQWVCSRATSTCGAREWKPQAHTSC
jgi:hypothetical protein